MSITETTKYLKVSVSRNSVKQNLMGCLILRNTQRGTVNKLCSSENAFSPKLNGKVGLKARGPSDLENVAMFSLNVAILLRSVNYRGLMDDVK